MFLFKSFFPPVVKLFKNILRESIRIYVALQCYADGLALHKYNTKGGVIIYDRG